MATMDTSYELTCGNSVTANLCVDKNGLYTITSQTNQIEDKLRVISNDMLSSNDLIFKLKDIVDDIVYYMCENNDSIS